MPVCLTFQVNPTPQQQRARSPDVHSEPKGTKWYYSLCAFRMSLNLQGTYSNMTITSYKTSF